MCENQHFGDISVREVRFLSETMKKSTFSKNIFFVHQNSPIVDAYPIWRSEKHPDTTNERAQNLPDFFDSGQFLEPTGEPEYN